MGEVANRAIAIVGVGAILPDAPDARTFWDNTRSGRYSITDVDPERWDPELFYDPDPAAPDKAYSKIGGWCHEWDWSPLEWGLPIPPKVSDAMDRAQKWSVNIAREALLDYGYPARPLDTERTAVILGNALAGDKHYLTAIRIYFPEYARALEEAPSFAALPLEVREAVVRDMHARITGKFPPINEDTMPGELPNIIAGRVANLFDLNGPNFVVDAACASALAAFDAAIEGLEGHDFDAVLTGGVDANMSATSFIKFCKIGALSATGTRPYADGADGFVMGEGAAMFLLKRLADAEAAGDRIYAVIRGLGGASDGRGKGITAPNPVGQRLAVERAWVNAGVKPDGATLVEGHGTSTRVGDVVEVQSLSDVFEGYGLDAGSVPLGSVKSNIGHLKSSAGAAGLLKATLALDSKTLPPSLGYSRPNPNIDWGRSPFYVNTELRPWDVGGGQVRRAGVSAFGFGGTNFHAVLEEYVPGRITDSQPVRTATTLPAAPAADSLKAPLRGAFVAGGSTTAEVADRLRAVLADATEGRAPAPAPPAESDLRAPERIAIDYADAADLAAKAEKALQALESGNEVAWKMLRGRGVFRGSGEAPPVAFLYTGQGSQYVNMLGELRESEPIVSEMFVEADAVMAPLLDGKPLTDFIFVADDAATVATAEEHLRQTEITQPAVLAVDTALTKLLAAYGVSPDMVMGHSLGEYSALIAAGSLPFDQALEAVSARGREMASLTIDDRGKMAAVFGSLSEVERAVDAVDGYAVLANRNSYSQSVVGGASAAVEAAIAKCQEAGLHAVFIPVSHAFHTAIVAPAAAPLTDALRRFDLRPPQIPLVANLNGEFYPMGPGVEPEMIEILGQQIASPVQFVKGLETLYDAGVRVFVEVGPKRALHGFAEDVLAEHDDVVALYTNHPKYGDVASFNQALCGLYAAGLGFGAVSEAQTPPAAPSAEAEVPAPAAAAMAAAPVAAAPVADSPSAPASEQTYLQLGHLFADFLERGYEVYSGRAPAAPAVARTPQETVVISGAGIGLPGGERVFGDENVDRILEGEQFIDVIPMRLRQEMTNKRITRLVKTEAGGGRFETIDSVADVIKLAARGGTIDLAADFGFPEEREGALDVSTKLAIGAGLDALRDAGIPLVMHYKTTTTGSKLPERWMLPEALRDETGVIFASAFPGLDSFADELDRFHTDVARRERLRDLESLRARVDAAESAIAAEIDHRIHELRAEIERDPYIFDRRFLFRVLSMGHSQFAEYIGARGPNTQINAACASTTQAVGIAQDWIRAGRCRRVVILSADDATTDHLMGWVGSGFLASGAAATDEVVEEAAIPFDRRRHGLILGMGAAALVVESEAAVAERGLQPICRVLSTVTANSAFHGSRLDVDHIRFVMETVVSQAEQQWGVDRHRIAPNLMFVSHETYTPARGGSAQAEVDALRHVFGTAAPSILVANTKGYTGHPMGVGIEDVVAVKSLETGIVPPVANFREEDPDLGHLNLSRGGAYPVYYALRLGAGFGSQISLSLVQWVPTADGRRRPADELGYEYRIVDPGAWDRWLAAVSGYEQPEVEVAQRTLRFKDSGPPLRKSLTPAATVIPVAVAPPPAPVVAAPTPPVRTTPPPAPTPADLVVEEPAAVSAPVVSVSAPVAGVDAVEARVLEIVADQTGYPAEMLELDLDLEADLGIDTVKQAETFAAIREEWGIERDDSLALRDYPTLGHVIGFVKERSPEAAAVSAPVVSVSAPVAGVDAVEARVLEIVADQTGYPAEMLELDLDLEADLGIDTVKQAETFAAIREEWGIERDDSLALRDYPTLGHVIGFVKERSPEAAAVSAPVVSVSAPVAGVDAVEARVLEIVADQTGYPAEMLELDLDLEADLGIDTVKQAETFAAIREEWGIERDDSLALRDYPTLGHVIGFVKERSPEAAAVSAPVVSVSAPVAGVDAVEARVLEIVADQTGYPAEMLELDLDLEADLGIDTVKQAETFAAIREEWGIERDDSLALRDYPTLGHVIGFVKERSPEAAAVSAPVVSVSAPVAGVDAVEARVLEIVADQTGYPAEMLELDLDLEADLGIDTVKQAETFAAIREEWGIERDDSLALRDYPTLGHVIGFVKERMPTTGGTAAIETAPEAAPDDGGAPAGETFGRIPVPYPRPAVDRCKATGVELGAGSRVIVALDGGGVGKALVQRLEKLGVEVLAIEDAPESGELTERLNAWLDSGPIDGVYWLTALDAEPNVADMDLAAWREALRVRVKLLYQTMRTLYDAVSGPGTFLVAGTRLGGLHGYDPAGAVAPMGGAVSGFVKTYKREKPEAMVKAVDFAPSRKTAALADHLIDETRRDPGVVEVGYRDGVRFGVALRQQPAGAGDGMTLGPNSVFVITGAAGSITSAITADLAAASGGVFHLLDLAPEPDRADEDVARFAEDREGLKRDIFDRIRASGERATPALVEKELARLERLRAALDAIEAVQRAGGTAHYYSVNLMDGAAMAAVTAQIAQRSDKVDVLVHAGGLEISRLLPDKEPAEYDLVFDVKADGWFNLMSGLGGLPLGAAVVFSSIAGRFGNAGQSDYSAANDLLCKSVASFRTSRPETRGIAIDWTAWGDIGMATRGSIPTVMKAAGIDMLPASEGIPVVRTQLTGSAWSGEVMIAGSLGLLLDGWDETGGIDPVAFASGGVMVGGASRLSVTGEFTVTTELDPSEQPFLFDHRIDGTPVLPGVMGIESFAETAALLFPDLEVTSVEDVTFSAPFKFYRDEPRAVTVQAVAGVDDDGIFVKCRLIGSRVIATQAEPQVTEHFTGTVRMGSVLPEVAGRAVPARSDQSVDADAVYRIYFHGPAYQVLDAAWRDDGQAIGLLPEALPRDREPVDAPLVMEPRLIELCFQAAGIFEIGTEGTMGLPLAVDRVSTLRPLATAEGRVYAAVTPTEDGYAVVVIDDAGAPLVAMAGYRTVQLPGAMPDEYLAPLTAAMGGGE